MPDSEAVCENYENCLASAMKDLGSTIKENMMKHNSEGSHKFGPGVIKAKVKVYNGCDGFGNLKMITKKSERDIHDHGIGYDFTITVVEALPNQSTDSEEMKILETDLSVESDASSYCSSTELELEALTLEDVPEECAQQVNDESEEPEYVSVFEEKNPQSTVNTRPVEKLLETNQGSEII